MQKSLTYLFSSDPKNGATRLNSNRNEFSVQFNDPISIPPSATFCTGELHSSSIWNTSFNISAEIGNNVIHIIVEGGTYNITVDDGQYSVSALNANIGRALVSLGFPSNAIVISGDSSTQRTLVQFGVANVQIDFTQGLFRELLGFNARIMPEVGQVSGYFEFSDNAANFNRVNSYLLTSTLCSNGLPVNSTANGILARIPILAGSGSLSQYEPANPLRVDLNDIIGNPKRTISFRLLDQNGRSISTNGEYFEFAVVIRY
jgi:hypothetical protein